ncbi:MAG: dipeptide epimerase, partial [Gemmatimonadetes bacterium]|nr:dipeptide epimerase [Gemmatimonadota bacterium]
MALEVAVEQWPIAGRFTIARESRTEAVVVVVMLRVDGA